MSVYVALHAYRAEQEGDISFQRGDAILVRTPEAEREEHWWVGRVMDDEEDSDVDGDDLCLHHIRSRVQAGARALVAAAPA